MDKSEALLENYNDHYKRVNGETNPAKSQRKRQVTNDLQYGPYVRDLKPESKVLDLGCGTGFLLHWLTKFENIKLFGVDASISQAEVAAKALPRVEIKCQDGLEYLQNHQNEFDVIFSTDLLEHLGNNEVCLKWMHAVHASLKPNGTFVCRTPNGANLLGYYTLNHDLTHQRSFSKLSMLQLFEASGFSDCDIKPTKSRTPLGKIRQILEKNLHRFFYLVCGAKMNMPVSRHIIGVARKTAAPAKQRAA